MDSYFYLFISLLPVFFSFLCQESNKTRSNCAIVSCNLSKKDKLTLYKTELRVNYVDHTFLFHFCQELPACTKPWGQTSKYYRAGYLVGACIGWLYGYMTSGSLLQCLLNTPWKYILLMPIFYLSGASLPSPFPLQFG